MPRTGGSFLLPGDEPARPQVIISNPQTQSQSNKNGS